MRSPRALRSPARFRPHVELLEGRCLLSVTVHQVGGALTITGTNQSDDIIITENGTHVGVYTGKSMHFLDQASNVTTINVNAGGGNDHVRYDVQGVSASQLNSSGNAVDAALNINLGSGNNRFSMNVLTGVPTTPVTLAHTADPVSNVAANSDLSVQVRGGSGNDQANLHALSVGSNATLDYTFQGGGGRSRFDVTLGNKGDSLQTGSTVDLSFLGGSESSQANIVTDEDLLSTAALSIALGSAKGAEHDSVQYTGQDKGSLVLQENGSSDSDSFDSQVSLSSGSTGTVQANENGDAGDDDLTLAIRQASASDHPTIHAKIDGGAGKDTCAATDNVTSVNCEINTKLT